MHIDQIKTLAQSEMQAVDSIIQQSLHSDVVLINQLADYIIKSGGKRLRPLVVVLSALSCGYHGKHHQMLAAVVEFIHTATLLHDDVVDDSDLRRGKDTANAVWGNAASVLVGDFLYSRAFEMMVSVQQMRVMEILSHTTNTIAKGEVMQLMNCRNPKITQQDYMRVITRKTAQLFSAATQLGAVLAQSNSQMEQAMTDYGLALGIAFQLVDDALDYSASVDDLGKNIGDDLAEGKVTLPLIYAMQQGNAAQVELIQQTIEQGGREQLVQISAIIKETNAIDATLQQARKFAEQAQVMLGILPDSDYKQALLGLAKFAVARRH